jgi:hypothetical protein
LSQVHHDTTAKALLPVGMCQISGVVHVMPYRDTTAVIAFSGPDIASSTQPPIRSKVPMPSKVAQWTDGVEFLVGQARAA